MFILNSNKMWLFCWWSMFLYLSGMFCSSHISFTQSLLCSYLNWSIHHPLLQQSSCKLCLPSHNVFKFFLYIDFISCFFINISPIHSSCSILWGFPDECSFPSAGNRDACPSLTLPSASSYPAARVGTSSMVLNSTVEHRQLGFVPTGWNVYTLTC